MRYFLLLGIAASAQLLGGDALAAGFATARFGGEHGTPLADNPTAIYYNPAGIALSRGVTIFVDGNVALRSLTYERTPDARAASGESTAKEVPEPADGVGANIGKATLFNVVAAPMLGATVQSKVSDSIGLAGGLAFFVPFGGSATWDKNEAFRDHPKYAGPVDGTQRFYTIHGTLRTIYVSAALALSIKDVVALGVSGGIALNSIDSMRSRDVAGDTNLENEGRAWFKGKNTTGQLGAGVTVTPLDDKRKLRLGVSYQAPPGFGRMKLKGLLQKYFAGSLSGEVEGKDDVELHQTLPDVLRFGVSFRPRPELELRAFGDYTRWSLFDDQCINNAGAACLVREDGSVDTEKDATTATASVNLPRRWRDSAGARVGASYWVRDAVELFVGLGYDSSAVPDATLEPSLVDFHSVGASLGVRAQLVDQLALAVGYSQFFYFTRNIIGKSENPYFKFPSNSPDAGGIYKQSIGVINVNLQASFDPFTKPAPQPATGGSER